MFSLASCILIFRPYQDSLITNNFVLICACCRIIPKRHSRSVSRHFANPARQLCMQLNLVKSPLLHMQPLCFFLSLSPLTPCSCMPQSSFIGKKREMYEHPVFCLASQVMDLTIREYTAHLEPLHHFRQPLFYFFSHFFLLKHFHK